MENEKGRTSRASSTSSLGREVRCGCQYFKSDSLLPERRAMMMLSRPSSRASAKTQPGMCEHEYEPVGAGMSPKTSGPAPVVRILDTDIVPVGDSDDSIDVGGRFSPGVGLVGDVVLPLDGRIEDNAMESRELGSGDLSGAEEPETAQQLQDRLEERFFSAATPATESRTDGEINTSQVDSSVMEELPLRRGARGLPQKIRTQAGKLRTRLKNINRPTFTLPMHDRRHKSSPKIHSDRSKSDKSKSRSSDKSSTLERASKASSTDKRTRMERIRASLPDRPRFSLDKSRFSLPDRPKFNFSQRKFHLPERPKINLPRIPSRSSFRMPSLPGRRRAPTLAEQQRQYSNESNAGSRKNIFDFSTVPRLFDRKSKARDYTTSSPKESRASSSGATESATLPRAKKPKASFGSRWTQRFTDIKFADDDEDPPASIDREKPWQQAALEKPRLSLRGQESLEGSEPPAWEESEEHRKTQEFYRCQFRVPSAEREEEPELELEEGELEQEKTKQPHRHKHQEVMQKIMSRGGKIFRGDSEDSYEPPQIDPRLYGDQNIALEDSGGSKERDLYRVAFQPVDPRDYKKEHARDREKIEASLELDPGEQEEEEIDEEELEEEQEEEEEEEEEIEVEEEIEENIEQSSELEEDVSARSDREQQASSGSSCDRRRRGVIEEIDSDEFFLRAKGISQDDMHVGRYLTSEIRDALRTSEQLPKPPPQRPQRTRSMRKRESIESYDVPPTRPKRRSQESDFDPRILDNDDSFSESRHRIVYHAESAPLDLNKEEEPLDDIVVVKPMRRKSRTSRSSSRVPSDPIKEFCPELPIPPAVPKRRKRHVHDKEIHFRVNGIDSCNGHDMNISVDTADEAKPRPKSEPIKPSRVPSHETISITSKVDEEEYIEPAPIPPKRHSRSRTTSIIQDDDRTSREADSIPDLGYDIEEMQLDEPPGYAVIEKREKPPRPPPPRKKRKDKFATLPRSNGAPVRPIRNYSTLRPRSRTPSVGSKTPLEDDVTPYVEIESDEEHKNLLSGEVLNKMASRPLPAPPRPPRSRKDKTKVEAEFGGDLTEAYASTQTDPLPDDMVIEEEITQAKLVVAPSNSGSQIMVSMERIPSPAYFRGVTAISHERIPSPQEFYTRSSAISEPDIRGSRITPERDPEPKSLHRVPDVPPLPQAKEDNVSYLRSKSPSVTREIIPERPESRVVGLEELEERLSAFLTNETLKIASLEVADLKVDRLSVSSLEAHKIAASEIDAVVVSATEIANTSEEDHTMHPSLLEELIAIKAQLEMVSNQVQESHEKDKEPHSDFSRTESTLKDYKFTIDSGVEADHLQLDSVSKTTEARAIFSTQGVERPPSSVSSSESKPKEPEKPKRAKDLEKIKEKEKEIEIERSGSNSPVRMCVRQTASPVRSLPPVISVTPDSPDVLHPLLESSETRPQRATITYSEIEPERPSRPSSPLTQSRPSSPQQQQFIAFTSSQIPPQFFALASPSVDEPSVLDMTNQLVRALRQAGKRAMRHFVNYMVSRVSREESEAKIREIELAICALLLIIAGLIIVCFAGPRTVNHHHHWDYFNPPRM
ncbi:F-actin-monooxygenase MICAL3 isoform X2 [Cotesia glomerata]|uniref:F-actin-monooxygenase MICAL3 isoform X2 n=1 Tax=Cotesia glomerata TaxID=32391 RepID=UPI001D02E86B|nr:F-actin-monooxygenase MICAL3 isoform X2 [Cotesia glomerata]